MAGINKTLYDNRIQMMLTKQDIMDNLHIKDEKLYYRLLKEGLPHIKVGRSYVTPLDAYNKWIEKNTCCQGSCQVNYIMDIKESDVFASLFLIVNIVYESIALPTEPQKQRMLEMRCKPHIYVVCDAFYFGINNPF